mmetsp:Transcript_11818/g.36038  ORF Transcript_11818/g.36038 Transcript_11818/m.36038 type:complete len:1826 (+) Transcript_11818:227-5704(+)
MSSGGGSSLDEAERISPEPDVMESSDTSDGMEGDEDEEEDEEDEDEDEEDEDEEEDGPVAFTEDVDDDLGIDEEVDEDGMEEDVEDGDEDDDEIELLSEWPGRVLAAAAGGNELEDVVALDHGLNVQQVVANYGNLGSRPLELRFVERGDNRFNVGLEANASAEGFEEVLEELWQGSGNEVASMVAALGAAASVAQQWQEHPSMIRWRSSEGDVIGDLESAILREIHIRPSFLVSGSQDEAINRSVHPLLRRGEADAREGAVESGTGAPASGSEGGTGSPELAHTDASGRDGDNGSGQMQMISRLMHRFATNGRANNVGGSLGALGREQEDSFAPLRAGSVRTRMGIRDRDRSVPMGVMNRWTYDPVLDGGNDHDTFVKTKKGKSVKVGEAMQQKVVKELNEMLRSISTAENKVKVEKDKYEKRKIAQSFAADLVAQETVNPLPEESTQPDLLLGMLQGGVPGSGSSMQLQDHPPSATIQPEASQDQDMADVTRTEAPTAATVEADAVGSSSVPAAAQASLHDGNPVTAADVAVALNIALGQNSSNGPAAVPGESGTRFQSVAEERADARGISLHAPASTDPAVVQTATQATGIDPTFLAALPEEMRTEVLAQHIEQLATEATQMGSDSANITVNQEFLAALPPELRAEVLVQESHLHARRAQEREAEARAGSSNAADMDNASFLATLQPQLREEVLLNADEDFLETLPPAVSAEARLLRERFRQERSSLWRLDPRGGPGSPLRNNRSAYRMRAEMRGGNAAGSDMSYRRRRLYDWGSRNSADWQRTGQSNESKVRPFLDEDGLVSIVRLLYFHHSLGKNLMSRLLACACKNKQLRDSVLHLLLEVISTEAVASTTGEPVRDDKGTPLEPEFAESRGPPSTVWNDTTRSRSSRHIVARRALELLTNLAEKDKLIRESIAMREDEEDGEQKGKDLHLNELLSLLSTELFSRSTAHLEQLVKLLSLACDVLPSPEQISGEDHEEQSEDDPDREEEGSPPQPDVPGEHAARDQAGGGRAGRGQMGRGQMGRGQAARAQAAREQATGAQAAGGQASGEQVSAEPAAEAASATAPPVAEGEGQNSNNMSTDTTRTDAERAGADDGAAGQDVAAKDDAEERKRMLEKIPKVTVDELHLLAGVLSKQGCADATYQRVINILDKLSTLPDNRIPAVHALAAEATQLGTAISEDFRAFLIELEQATAQGDSKRKAKILLGFSTAASSNELKLLRLAKTITTLAKSDGESVESAFHGLKGLWEVVSDVLDAVTGSEDASAARAGDRGEMDSDRLEPGPAVGESSNDLMTTSDIPGRLDATVVSTAREDGNGARVSTSQDYAYITKGQQFGRHNVPPILARLSPVIQSFFVAHSADDDTDKKKDPAAFAGQASFASIGKSRSLLSESESEQPQYASNLGFFIEKHRVPVNMLLRATPSLLEGSFFKSALKYAQWIDFDNKKTYFRNLIKQRTAEARPSTIRIRVRRSQVFEDSYYQLRLRTADEMKGRLNVQFLEEEGIDAGGVTREWYTILARKIFDANYALFRRSTAKSATYQPNTLSYINEDHLGYFRFVGRIIGKAIYDGQLLDAYFTRSFYKHILGIPPNYHDLEALEPEYYKSLCWILENDIDGVLDLTFSAEHDDFGCTKVVDLIPNGRNIAVTNENKREYVRLITDLRLTKAIKHQIDNFLKGFQELIPREDVKIFNELELELLMSGLPDIDVADLKANVEYLGYTLSSPQITWFWKTVSQMGKEDLARLIMFTTGTSKVPLEGFAALQGMNGLQKFQIHCVAGDINRLPTAHTCFNQLDLPEYPTEEKLRKSLLVAIREGAEGFGFG